MSGSASAASGPRDSAILVSCKTKNKARAYARALFRNKGVRDSDNDGGEGIFIKRIWRRFSKNPAKLL